MMDVTADRNGREGCSCLLYAGYQAKSFTHRMPCHRGAPRYWNHHYVWMGKPKSNGTKVNRASSQSPTRPEYIWYLASPLLVFRVLPQIQGHWPVSKANSSYYFKTRVGNVTVKCHTSFDAYVWVHTCACVLGYSDLRLKWAQSCL